MILVHFAKPKVRVFLNAAKWEESKHPRAKDGKFGKGSGTGKTEKGKETKQIKVKKDKIDQTKTKAFRNWFGDSKIVNPDGSPKIVYHGSPNKFDTFDPEKTEGMIWLSGNKEYADYFAGDKNKSLALYANIKTPLDVKEFAEEKGLPEWQETLEDLGINTEKIDWEEADWAPDYGAYTFFDLLPHAGNNYINTGLLDAIKSSGYDGILAPPEENDGIKSDYTVVAFDPNQVKSATDNSGSFDPNSDKITNATNQIRVHHARA